MRLKRLILGGVVLVGAVWVLVGEQMAGASADAVINARLDTIRSPVAGEVSMTGRALGSRVRDGEELAKVADPRVDRVRLQDLVKEQKFADAALERLDAQAEETAAEIAALDARTVRVRDDRTRELEAMLAAARRRLARLDGIDSADGDEVTGITFSSERPARPPEGDVATRWSLETARERIATLEVALEAMRNDAAFGLQRGAELRDRRARLAAEITEAEARLAAVTSRLRSEQYSTSQMTETGLAAPSDGQIWAILADDGTYVERGDPILRMVDCESVLVTLSVTEGVFNTLSLGDTARFRLASDGRAFDGTITRLAGSGAGRVYETLAISPDAAHLERFDVALLVPDLARVPDLSCPVGRTGRVFFERRPLDWLRRG